MQLKRYTDAVKKLSKAQWRISNDPEVQYYLGNAWRHLGEDAKARRQWEGAVLLPGFRVPALLQLAGLAARETRYAESLELIRRVLKESPRAIRAGQAEVALLRKIGDTDEAKARLAYWLEIDPASSFLRNEAVELGGKDDELWRHLAGDPERILEIAVDYMGLALYRGAITVLSREYPSEGVVGEPGFVLPRDYPLIAYYRGYCREMAGESGRDDFLQASRQPTKYVFPNRAETFPVLRKALDVDPRDATARFLLGSLHLSGGMADEALQEWQTAKMINPAIPVLHRNIGMTLIHAKSDPARALEIFKEGMERDARNADLYLGADQCMSLIGKGAEERIAILKKYPDQAALPAALIHKLALSLAEAGRSDEAEKLYQGRFFPREEFGTNVRQSYLEVRLQKALRLAREGRKEEALAVKATIGLEIPGLPFTQDGLAPFIDNARYQYYLGVVEAACGGADAARAHWRKASGNTGYRQVYFSYLAARKLGQVDETAWIELFRTRLKEAEAYGGHFPGLAVYAQGVLLQALGQNDEGRQKLKEALLYPDKGMSHYLCREALSR